MEVKILYNIKTDRHFLINSQIIFKISRNIKVHKKPKIQNYTDTLVFYNFIQSKEKKYNPNYKLLRIHYLQNIPIIISYFY